MRSRSLLPFRNICVDGWLFQRPSELAACVVLQNLLSCRKMSLAVKSDELIRPQCIIRSKQMPTRNYERNLWLSFNRYSSFRISNSYCLDFMKISQWYVVVAGEFDGGFIVWRRLFLCKWFIPLWKWNMLFRLYWFQMWRLSSRKVSGKTYSTSMKIGRIYLYILMRFNRQNTSVIEESIRHRCIMSKRHV